jgi:hypothetical protein
VLADADAVMSPDEFDLELGSELAGPADYDDDGYDDLAVGSKRRDMNGGVFVLNGPPANAKSGVDSDAIVRGYPGDEHGFSMSVLHVGGPDALAVGAPSAGFAARDAGSVTVLVGPLSGFYYLQADGVSVVQTEEASAFGSALATTNGTSVVVGAPASDAVFLLPATAFGF